MIARAAQAPGLQHDNDRESSFRVIRFISCRHDGPFRSGAIICSNSAISMQLDLPTASLSFFEFGPIQTHFYQHRNRPKAFRPFALCRTVMLRSSAVFDEGRCRHRDHPRPVQFHPFPWKTNSRDRWQAVDRARLPPGPAGTLGRAHHCGHRRRADSPMPSSGLAGRLL